jgi:sarcosine dehydrogenase
VLVGRETILRNGEFAGYLTSGGYGYTIGKPVGYGYVRNAAGVDEQWLSEGRYELVVAGDVLNSSISTRPLFDPQMLRIKA